MSPRTEKQLSEIRKQSKDKILEAALELFATKGFHSTSISEIAQKANVAKGLIYNYFRQKEDLMYEIVYQALGESDDFIKEIGAIEDSKGRLRHLLEFSFSYMIDRFRHAKLMAALSFQLDTFPDIQNIIEGKYLHVMPLMEGLLSDAGFEEPKKEARYLAAVMDGVGIQYFVLKDALPIEEIKNDLIEKYCT